MTAVVDTDQDPAIHDCWNHIGIQGDRSCSKLRQHIHCRNCGVYSAAARSLLDVPLPADHLTYWTNHTARPREQSEHHAEAVLVLRSSVEWLALPTARCEEVVGHRTIRKLPHRRNAAVLGLANIRGELVVCLSLAALLGIQPGADAGARRLLIINGEDAATALQVDEVVGTHRFNSRDLARPATPAGAAANAAGTLISATLRWRDHTIGVLDEDALFARIARSLA